MTNNIYTAKFAWLRMLAYIYRRMSYDNHWIQCTGSDSAVHNYSLYNFCQIFRSSQSCDRFSHHKPQNTVGVKWKEKVLLVTLLERMSCWCSSDLMYSLLNCSMELIFTGINTCWAGVKWSLRKDPNHIYTHGKKICVVTRGWKRNHESWIIAVD